MMHPSENLGIRIRSRWHTAVTVVLVAVCPIAATGTVTQPENFVHVAPATVSAMRASGIEATEALLKGAHYDVKGCVGR